MANPKVIIADTDINYIAPLQYKFINDYFNNIDLEIITDQQYFNEYFSMPRTAEVLIVSEEMYEASLKRHDIKNILIALHSMVKENQNDKAISYIEDLNEICEQLNLKNSFRFTVSSI